MKKDHSIEEGSFNWRGIALSFVSFSQRSITTDGLFWDCTEVVVLLGFVSAVGYQRDQVAALVLYSPAVCSLIAIGFQDCVSIAEVATV